MIFYGFMVQYGGGLGGFSSKIKAVAFRIDAVGDPLVQNKDEETAVWNGDSH